MLTRLLVATLFGHLLAAVLAPLCAQASTDQNLLIQNVHIVSPEAEAPYGPVDVAVRDGRISALGKALSSKGFAPAQIIAGAGRFLTPGLMDSHVHLSTIPGMHGGHEAEFPQLAQQAKAQIPRSYLYHGFTSVVDLIAHSAAIEQWNSQAIRPQAYFSGAAPIMDGYPTHRMPKEQRYHLFPNFLYDPTRADEFPADFAPENYSPEVIVARLAADGASAIKTFYEDGFGAAKNIPVPPQSVLKALVAAANERGLPVILHANSENAQAAGVAAGIDAFAHGLWTWDSADDDELTPPITAILDGIIEQNIAWQPTIQVLYGERDLFDPDFLARPDLRAVVPPAVLAWYASEAGQWLAEEMRQFPYVTKLESEGRWQAINAAPIRHVSQALTYLAERDGHLLFGSDSPSAPTYANPAGLNGRLEMDRWVEAGVSPRAILKAATLVNAQFFGLEDDLGSVEPGKRADLLLMRENPLAAVEAYDTIDLVILAGHPLPRASLAADADGTEQ